jgi:hypothetical protein
MNILYEEACRLEKIMLKDTSLNVDVCEKYRCKVNELYLKMAESDFSPLTHQLRKIIKSSNYLGVSSVISKLIRSFLIEEC